MDFKSLINKLDSMEAPIATPKAPELPKTVQLDEDHSLKVLAGTKTLNEAVGLMEKKAAEKKEKEEKEKPVKEEMKVGEKKKSSTGGTIEKTKTGVKHTAGKNYGGKAAEDEDKKKSKKDESVDVEAFKSKFAQMVAEAKKKKPDSDGDGVPDWADEKPGEDDNADKKKTGKKGMSAKQAKYFGKKNESVKESDDMKVGEKKKSSTGGTIEKTAAGVKHTAGKNYGGKAAEDEAKKSKKDESVSKEVKGKAKKVVAESIEMPLSFREMMKLVVESGGQQQIDPMDKELFAWATRVSRTKLGEGMKADVYAGMVYERMGGVFEMYDVLSETKK
jgi:hypothetical protein